MLNTLHSLYKVILSKCELLYIYNKLQFSSDNVNNTLRGQSASKQGGGVAWGSDGKTAEVSQLTAVGWKVVEVISAESGAQLDTNPHSQLHPLL